VGSARSRRTRTATGYRLALRVPLVRRLWTATAASVVGDYIGQGALLLLAADRTGQALAAAAVLAVGVVPTLLTGVVAGPWLDRIPRVRALVALQLVGAAVICLPVLLEGIGVVYVTAALLAVVRTATIAVRSGAMAEGLEDDHRGPLVALLATTDQAGQVVGYLTGASLYLLLGTDVALLVDAASFVVGAAVLATLRLPPPAPRPTRLPVTGGLTLIARDPVLRLLAVLVVATGTVASLPEVLAPVVATAGDGWRPVVLAAAPLGQAITMAVIGRTPQIRRPSVQLAHLAWLVLALAITALGRSPAWIAFGNLLIGTGVAWIVGPQLTFLRLAPPARMAQITAAMVALLATADGIGSLAFARLADVAGVSTAYRTAGALLLAMALVGWVLKERTPDAHVLDRDELPAR
jgi:MFS family permease